MAGMVAALTENIIADILKSKDLNEIVQLETGRILWDNSDMKLTADSQGRLGSAELFRPQADFEATVQPDGSVHLVELTQVPVVKPRRMDGRLRGAEVRLCRQTVAAAVRAERDAR